MSELFFFPLLIAIAGPKEAWQEEKTVIAGSRADSEKVELEDVDGKNTGNREGSGVISLMTSKNSTPSVFNVV